MTTSDIIQKPVDLAWSLVERLSTTQVAAIGGTGSGASFAASAYVDTARSGLELVYAGLGAVGAFLTVGLLVLKVIQQRREMAHWHRTTTKGNDGNR